MVENFLVEVFHQISSLQYSGLFSHDILLQQNFPFCYGEDVITSNRQEHERQEQYKIRHNIDKKNPSEPRTVITSKILKL